MSGSDANLEDIDIDAYGTSDTLSNEAFNEEQVESQEMVDNDEEQLSVYDDDYFVPPTPPERTWSAGPPARDVPQTRRRWSAPRLPAFTMVGIVAVDDHDDVVEKAVDRIDMELPSTLSLKVGSTMDKDLDKAQEIAYNGYYEVLAADDLEKAEVEPEEQKDSQSAMGEDDDQETEEEQQKEEQQKEEPLELKNTTEDKKSMRKKKKKKAGESEESMSVNKGGYSHTWSSLPQDSRTFALARAPDVLKQPEETHSPSPCDSPLFVSEDESSDSGLEVHVASTGLEKLNDSGMPEEFKIKSLDKRITAAKVHNKSLELQLQRKKENSAKMTKKLDEMMLARANAARARQQEKARKQLTSDMLSRTEKRALKRQEKKAEKKAEDGREGFSNVAPNSTLTREEPKQKKHEAAEFSQPSQPAQPAQRVGGMRMSTRRARPKSKPQKHVETLERADSMEPRNKPEREVAHELIAAGIRNISAEDRLPSASERDSDRQEMVRDTDDEADSVGTCNTEKGSDG